MSLSEMTCARYQSCFCACCAHDPYILVPEMLQQLELSVRSLRKDGGGERFHDLLDRHGLPGKLVLRRAAHCMSAGLPGCRLPSCYRLPDETEGTHANGLEICIPDRRSILVRF